MKWVMGRHLELMVVGSVQKGDMKKMENVSDSIVEEQDGLGLITQEG